MAVIKAVEFPNRVFASKAELFKALKANEGNLIALKQAQIYKSSEKGQPAIVGHGAVKAAIEVALKAAGFEGKEGYIYPIVSTTKYMDTHQDVHFNGCFTKTVKEQQGKICYTMDHELKWDSILAWPKDVVMSIAEIPWSLVGKEYAGKTEALIFTIAKDKVQRPDVLKAIEDKVADFENSLRMVYYKVQLAIDSSDKEYKANKAYFDSRIGEIANKEVAMEHGYFWGVEELGISKEASLVVSGGSNDATRIYSKQEPGDHSEEHEPSEDTKLIDFDYLRNNLKL